MARENLDTFLQENEFTLDDITFPPLKVPDFFWKDVDLCTQLTNRIKLSTPLISSPMDTVTGSDMAILMALMGGIGAIHFGYPSKEDQIKEVEKVRRYEAGFIKKPIVLGIDANIGTVFEQAEINGFFSYPITLDGTLDTPMVGIVTRRDVRYKENLEQSVKDVMTPREKLIVANLEETDNLTDIKAVNKIIREKNLDTLPIVDRDFKIVALVTDSDLTKNQRYPLATKDENKQLKVLVAVESFLDKAKDRIMMAKDAGASGIVVDSRNIYASHYDIARFVKREAPELDVILGNIVEADVIREVMNEVGDFVDAFRIGIGTGEVCSTTEDLGIGRALGSALRDCYEALEFYHQRRGKQIGLIADGGIKSPAHIVGSLILGANAVMMGTGIGGIDESLAPIRFDEEKKMRVKRVRGMGSREAIRQRAGSYRYGVTAKLQEERYPEGEEKDVPYRGPGEPFINELFNGVKQSIQGLGHKDVVELQRDGFIRRYPRAASKGTL